MSSFLCKWFGIGCPKPPDPPTPTPKNRAVAVVTTVGGAYVRLDNKPDPFTGHTDSSGYLLFPEVPESLTATHLDIDANGYDHYSIHVDLPSSGNVQLLVGRTANETIDIELPPLKPSHVDPSKFSLQELARIRGAMWTVRGPWRFGPRPGDPSNITALEYIHSYGDDPSRLSEEQRRMLDTYKGLGYKTCCFGPPQDPSYRDQYPTRDWTVSPTEFERWLDWVQLFWDEGLTPIIFLHGDGETFEQTRDRFTPLIQNNERAKRLLRVVVPTGWEPTRYGWSVNTWIEFCKWAGELLPDALILIHTVPDVDAPGGTDERGNDDGRGNDKVWADIVPYIHGWLTQSEAFADPDKHSDPNHPEMTQFDSWAAMFDKNCQWSYYNRFHNGYANWPTNSKWGNEPIKIYAAEYCSYWNYHDNRPYEEGVKWGDRAMAVGADGYLDSGSVEVN